MTALKERVRKAHAAVNRFTSDPRFKWYQRGMWLISALWAGVVVAQSVSYYTYIGNGRTAQEQGRYPQSEEMFKLALDDVKKSLSFALIGKKDSRYANALNNLAELYRTEGRYPEAEAEYIEVRDVAEKYLGHRHEGYALSLNNLAALYRDEAKYDESERLYKQAIEAWKNDLKRPEDLKASASFNGLAKLYRDEGRYREAEPLYKHAIAIRQKALGPQHQDVAEIIGNLAGLYRDEGRFKDAEVLYVNALNFDAAALGGTHPYTATDMNNLAALYRDEGRYADAEKLYKKALNIRQQTLGQNHPYVAKCLLGLAENCRQSGRLNECEPLIQRALQIDNNAFGKQHPDYATACDTACEYYRAKFAVTHDEADWIKAHQYIEQALSVRAKLLRPDHPDLAMSRFQLAELLRLKGERDMAAELYSRALAAQQKVLGKDHPASIQTARALASMRTTRSV